ncbi:MAG: CYTH domain-containing protein [Bacteroidota bacterium]|nr:CYTH domain-containing protein [Bacteroidota bacterium]
MPKEIERKFLVRDVRFKKNASKVFICQAYLSRAKNRTIRIRIAGDQAFLTIKGKSRSSVRREYEYEIPLQHAREMLDHLAKKYLVEKYRYTLDYRGHTWEVDEFTGRNKGLYIAEIELGRFDEEFPLPPWVGEEVSDDPRYFNSNLSKSPYSTW